jgi:hypothetical protein
MAARKRPSRPKRRPSKSSRPKSSTRARKAAKRPKATAKRRTRPAARSRRPQKPKTASKRATARTGRPAGSSKAVSTKPLAGKKAGPKPKPATRAASSSRRRAELPPRAIQAPTAPPADERLIASARAGHNEVAAELAKHTAASPKLTAGDIDADWQDAYAIGDEAPGGDNPTPDQDRVDDIGRALGVSYQDAEELRGSDKIADRDRHRWELDPASSDDWPHKPDDKS